MEEGEGKRKGEIKNLTLDAEQCGATKSTKKLDIQKIKRSLMPNVIHYLDTASILLA